MSAILKFFRAFGGSFLVLVAVALIEGLAWLGWRLPNPSVVLLPLVILSTLLGGLAPGVGTALLSMFYFIYVHHAPGDDWLGGISPRAWSSITATALVVPLTEMFRRRLVAESDERFRTMADNVAQLAWMADEKGRIFWFNRRWYDYTGTTPEETRGWEWQQLIRPDHLERVVSKIRRSVKSGEMWEETFPLRARDGSYQWFLTRGVPVRDKRGRIRRWFGTNTDTSAQLEVEHQLLRLKENLEDQVAERTAVAEGRAEQLRLLAIELTEAEQRERRRLAQVLHDDLQQLLVAAKMQMAHAAGPGGSPEKVAAADDLISQAIEAARSLSKQLAPSVLYEEGLGAAIRWLGHSAKERYGLNVEVESTETGVAEDQWLSVFLFDVVRELLLNAAKHAATDRVRVSLHRAGGEISLRVEDFGKGFDARAAAQKNVEGGLGLFFIEHRIVLMGGKMEIDSAPEKGTRIHFKLPLAVASVERGGERERNPAAEKAGVGDQGVAVGSQ